MFEEVGYPWEIFLGAFPIRRLAGFHVGHIEKTALRSHQDAGR